MTDQQRADLCAREGYPLDTTPCLDRLASSGTWFNKAYTTMPLCVPARISMITGRYPSVDGVKANPNVSTATFEKDLFQVAEEAGYQRAIIGKNHTYISPGDIELMYDVEHMGHWGGDMNDERRAFNEHLKEMDFTWNLEPCPHSLEMQSPHLIVDKAISWLAAQDQPFLAQVSFPEPHNPYQCPEPYYSMFPPDSLPALSSGPADADNKGMPFRKRRKLQMDRTPELDAIMPRIRSLYHGMLRLIDDQVDRLVTHLNEQGLLDNTIIIFVSDHGDHVGEYGLYEKNTGLPETLCRIPLFFTGPDICDNATPHSAHISLADIMPTCCEMMGQPIPQGVQGRSLWPLLTGQDYPQNEFSSICTEEGFGGNFYQGDEAIPANEVPLSDKAEAWCNSQCHSGNTRMLRKDDWKLIYDALGRGELYHLPSDPTELTNRFNDPICAPQREELLQDLLKWTIRLTDPLPAPVRFEIQNHHPRNYLWE